MKKENHKKNNTCSEDYKVKRYLKRKEKRKNEIRKDIRSLVIVLLIQLLLFSFYAILLYHPKATIDNVETISFVADDVRIEKHLVIARASSKSSLYIYYGEDKYLYDCFYFENDCGGDRNEKLKSEQLNIMYMNGPKKGTKTIVDLRGEKTVFYTMDDYNAEQDMQIRLAIIIIVIFELIYLGVVLIFVKMLVNTVKFYKR